MLSEQHQTIDGFKIFKPILKLDLRASYGMYLIQLCKEADRESERLGRFIPHNPMTYDEFVENRKDMRKRSVFKKR